MGLHSDGEFNALFVGAGFVSPGVGFKGEAEADMNSGNVRYR